MAGYIYPRIEARRKDLGITKTRMAEVLGITHRALNNKLAGRSEFSAREVRLISIWWGVTIDSLLEDEQPLAIR